MAPKLKLFFSTYINDYITAYLLVLFCSTMDRPQKNKKIKTAK